MPMGVGNVMSGFSEVDRLPSRTKSMDDIREQAEEVGFLSPIDFAKLRGIHAQQVYQKIRQKKLRVFWCNCCGHGPYVEVAEATLLFMGKNEFKSLDKSGV